MSNYATLNKNYTNILSQNQYNQNVQQMQTPTRECFRFYVAGGRKPCGAYYGFDENYNKGLYQGRPIGFEFTKMEDRYKYAGKEDNTSEEIWRDGMQSPSILYYGGKNGKM